MDSAGEGPWCRRGRGVKARGRGVKDRPWSGMRCLLASWTDPQGLGCLADSYAWLHLGSKMKLGQGFIDQDPPGDDQGWVLGRHPSMPREGKAPAAQDGEDLLRPGPLACTTHRQATAGPAAQACVQASLLHLRAVPVQHTVCGSASAAAP